MSQVLRGVTGGYTPCERNAVLMSAMIGFGLDAFDIGMLAFMLVPLRKDFGVDVVALGCSRSTPSARCGRR